jgi:uncharacterized damage-inducible protein DinB
MFTREGLFKFRDWAQLSLEIMLDHIAGMPKDALLKPLDGFGWAKLRDQLLHMASAEAFWVTSAQGQTWEGWEFSGAHGIDTIREAFRRAFSMTGDFIAGLDEHELLLPRRIAFSNGDGLSISPALMVHHVVTHYFHHKGQVVAMCRLLGYPAPETDLDAVARRK